MAGKKVVTAKSRDPQIAALEAVYAALKDLDGADRKKVLSSVFALLDVDGLATAATLSSGVPVTPESAPIAHSSRPMSPIELLQEKKPQTNAQRIAVFAYYREKYEGLSRFAREDLKGYFAKARQTPAANFDRDFVEAVKKGWIHEDGGDSYLTSKGIEAIESGFEGERRHPTRARPPKSARRKK